MIRTRALQIIDNAPRQDWHGNVVEEKLKVRFAGKYYDDSLRLHRSGLGKELKEEPPTMMRKRHTLRRLSFEQQVQAAHMVFIEKETQAMAARQFRVSERAISRLVCKLRKSPNLLSEILARKDEHQAIRRELYNYIQEKIKTNQFIDSAHSLVKELA